MSPISPLEMDFSRETFAAFSNALAALYAASDREARLTALQAEARSIFGPCDVAIEPVTKVASGLSEAAAAEASRCTLRIPIAGTSSQVTLRREDTFTEEERFLVGQLHAHLAAAFGGQRVAPVATSRPPAEPAQLRGLGLTARECEVMYWVVQGSRDAEIARRLGVATRTVSKHMENILRKLGVETRLGAARIASDWLARTRRDA